jgi:hypothetical protein
MARKDREIAELVTPGRLDKPIIVLRKLNTAPLSVKPNRNAPSPLQRIGNGYIEQGVTESETTWFAQGYVINDQPRSSVLTDLVMKHTVGFALADTRTGEILREGGPGTLGAMEAMASSAKVQVSMEIAGLDEDAEEDAEAQAADAAIAEAEAAAAAEAQAEAADAVAAG